MSLESIKTLDTLCSFSLCFQHNTQKYWKSTWHCYTRIGFVKIISLLNYKML